MSATKEYMGASDGEVYMCECMLLCVNGLFITEESDDYLWSLKEVDFWDKKRLDGMTPYDALVDVFGEPLEFEMQ
jgi:hypothetical protein